jgi:capsular exopolysaccharide synthesis family protein
MTQVAYDGAQPQGGSANRSDPREFFQLLLRHKWILLACVILIPLATYLVSTRLPKTYEASTVLQLQSVGSGQSLPGVGDLSGSGDTQTGDRVAALIQTNGVADQAARVLHEPVGSLRGSVTAQANQDTGFITITAHASTPKRAAKIANAFADAVRITRARQGLARVNDAIATTQAQLKNSNQNTNSQLVQQLQGLIATRDALGQNAQVIQPATPPGSPASPDPFMNALLALVFALVFAAVLVALVDRLDRRLHDPDDLEKLTGSPLLVHIPPSAFPGSPPDPGVPLAFQMLRDSLVYFNVDRPLDSLIVVSSLKGEGKTTVAANLAIAYARTGKRIIAMDADLRSPELALRLGLESTPGLSTVLAGDATVEEAVRVVEPFGDNLRVLPGGPPPPNPSELLGSARMARLFDELVADSDLVIVDTPPLLVVSDSFGLLERASGAIGVARLDQTPKDAARRMADVVATVHTRLLGAVATGSLPVAGYGYGYGYGYGSTPPSAEPAVATDVSGNGHPAPAPEEQRSSGRLARIFRSG